MAESRFNPYIVGQITLLLGGIALALATLPQRIMQDGAERPDIDDPQYFDAIADENERIRHRAKPYRVASMAVAIVGLCLGPIGWRRERPPILSVFGISMCSVALFWYWIVLGVTIAIAVFLVFAILASLGGGL